MGGTCSIAPVSITIARVTESSVRWAAEARVITAPSASAVSVPTPSTKVLSYPLSASNRNWENLVASPKHSGKTPVANGSRLPVWPALAAPKRRLACWSAAFDDMPVGLSSTNRPSTCRPFLRRATISLPVLRRLLNHLYGVAHQRGAPRGAMSPCRDPAQHSRQSES